MPQSRILVTGSTGFIGKRLMRQLLARMQPADIVCLVKPPAGPEESRTIDEYRAAGARLIGGDLTLSPISDSPPPPVDVVIHLAANIDTSATLAESRINDVGTARLLDWLGDELRGARLVFSSSIAVLDRSGPATGPLVETSPCTPRTHYGRTKLLAEEVIRSRAAGDGYTYTILRLPTVYGPHQKPGGMFDQLLRFAATGSLLGRLNWPGRTSIVYVDDVARMLTDLSELPAAANETFCVATDESLTVGQLAQRLGDLTGHPVAPIDPPPILWRIARALAYNRAVATCVPPAARVAYWRLGLVVDDGFWQNARKLRGVYPSRLRSLDDGVRAMLEELREDST